jgi:tetratricopeptide (TPR) repeat protein
MRATFPHAPAHQLIPIAAALCICAAPALATPPAPPLSAQPSAVSLDDTPYFKRQRAAALLSQAQDLLDSRWSDAVALIQAAVALDDTDAATHFQAARLYLQGDAPDNALLHLQRYLALQPDPDDPLWADAHHRAATIHLHLQADPTLPSHLATAHLLAAERHLRAALASLLRAPSALPLLSDVEHMLALTLLWRRMPEPALRYLRAATLHAPSTDDANLRLEALLLRLLGQPAQAITVMERAKLHPTSLYQQPLTYADLDDLIANLNATAFAYADLDQHALALQLIHPIRAWLEAEHTLSPSAQTTSLLASLYGLLAGLADARHDPTESERFYREALKLQPEDPTSLNNLAWTLTLSSPPLSAATPAQADRLREALLLALAACDALPTPTSLDTLSEVYLRLNRFPDAAAANRRALLSYPDDPYLLHQQQRILAAASGSPTPPHAPHLRVTPWLPPDLPTLF